ncbi:hypothetical protein ACOSP7_022081 [Xanthoceras sorbifolium]
MLFGTAISFVKFGRIVASLATVGRLIELCRWISSYSIRLSFLLGISNFLVLFFGRFGADVIACCTIALSEWIPPILGYYKLNTNTALDCISSKTGLRVVGRDHLGMVVLSGMVSFAGLLSPAAAKAKAILFGFLMDFKCGFSKVSLNLCVAFVINDLNGDSLLLSEVGLLVDDIKDLVHRFNGEVSFSHSLRSANRVAHSLAKLALVNIL